MNVPNALTLLRFSLVPVIAVEILHGVFGLAFALFVMSAVSDFADGIIARHWNQRTRFGAVADPLADKLTVTVLLWMLDAMPWWVALAVVVRDALIVGGALAYHWMTGSVEMAPSRVSKINTGFEFMLLLCVLAIRAGFLPDGPWKSILMAATLVTIFLSGGSYVNEWSRKAAGARRAAAPAKARPEGAEMDEIWPPFRVFLLLAMANTAPLLTKHWMGARWAAPVDGGWNFFDGRPLFGSSKTIRGIVAAVVATALAAFLMGLPAVLGALVGSGAMLGDLLSRDALN